VNILDEDIVDPVVVQLRAWRIRVRKIGPDVGRHGMTDVEILPLLHRLKQPTLFTHDLGFYHRRNCHRNACIVVLAVAITDLAGFARRFLGHPTFHTSAARMGCVVQVSVTGLKLWRLHGETEEEIAWPE
jgi:hypothetical protein